MIMIRMMQTQGWLSLIYTWCHCRRYDAEMEEALEDAYQGYLRRKGKREELEAAKAEAQQRVKRARLGQDGGLGGLPGDEEEGDDILDEGEEADVGARRGRKRPAPPMFTTVPADHEEVRSAAEDNTVLTSLCVTCRSMWPRCI